MAALGDSLNLERDINRAVELLQKLQRSGAGGEKLVALEQVLSSEFLAAVRQVYEQVHRTADMGAGPAASADIRASATAKGSILDILKEKLDAKYRLDETYQATVAAFAASEGRAQPRVVRLPKTDEGLGFNVMGGKEQNSAIYISRIIPGGLAERQGGLRRGDQLLAVNGVSVEGENHERAVELLKQAQGTVTLVVRYAPHVLEQMEMRFDRQHHNK